MYLKVLVLNLDLRLRVPAILLQLSSTVKYFLYYQVYEGTCSQTYWKYYGLARFRFTHYFGKSTLIVSRGKLKSVPKRGLVYRYWSILLTPQYQDMCANSVLYRLVNDQEKKHSEVLWRSTTSFGGGDPPPNPPPSPGNTVIESNLVLIQNSFFVVIILVVFGETKFVFGLF